MNDEEMKSLFHNLKNDLASMTSLLNLHKLYKDSIEPEELLNRLFERQIIIATAYEKLYQEGDYPWVGLINFINELLSREGRTLTSYSHNVNIRKEIPDIRLPVKRLTPLAQILVELLSNSYRHAFTAEQESPTIFFRITEEEDRLKLGYEDNGTGLPAEFNHKKSRTLGMQFINALSRQLGGKPEFNSPEGGGMSFSLDVKK
ncbi:MAG: ATP-binding protein [Spirochaetales bacterium]|uniref:histidine kinase n=1 Tax=Candidatus Thalassospirochaeta sargassi TaxID=3119039 RepID=A0AAJ1IA05_9SPIO|nr:ATP-binding protein [Spirochaetales bacterium]